MTTEDALARAFTALWDAFIDCGGIEPDVIETIIEKTGLATWETATEQDVENTTLEIEVGDPLLRLTEEGRRVVRLGRDAT